MYFNISAYNAETRKHAFDHIECADYAEAFNAAHKLAISIGIGLYKYHENKSYSDDFVIYFDGGHAQTDRTSQKPKTNEQTQANPRQC